MNRNRGKQSNDDRCFGTRWQPVLREAVDDCVYLLTRGYGEQTVIQTVGNRYKLNRRQRLAVQGAMAGRQQTEAREKTRCPAAGLAGEPVAIDGFNLLILLESALSGAYIFQGRDGACRDISGVHGSYKRVRKTSKAIELTGRTLEHLKVTGVTWLLDRPVSNSGRLKTELLETAERFSFPWEVDLVYNPDKVLAESEAIVVSSDAWVLDHAARWFNLGRNIIENHMEAANRIIL